MKTNELKVNQMEQVTGGNEIDVLKEIIMDPFGPGKDMPIKQDDAVASGTDGFDSGDSWTAGTEVQKNANTNTTAMGIGIRSSTF